MSVAARMAGIPEDGIGDKRLITALAMGRKNMQELVSIANGAPPKDDVDSMYAVIAMNMLKTAKKAQQERQAQQQPQPSIKDQVVSGAMDAGLGAVNAGNLMDEKTLAAGGIVAFDEGGEVDKYDQNGVRRYALGDVVTSSPLGRTFAGIFGPSEQEAVTGPAYMAGITAYDARINQIASRLNALGGYFGTTQQTPAQRQEYDQLTKELVRLQGEKEALARNINRAYETKPSPISAPSASASTNPPAPAPADAAAGATGTPGGPAAPRTSSGIDAIPGIPLRPTGVGDGSSTFGRFQSLADTAASDIRKVDPASFAEAAQKDPRLTGLFGLTRDQYVQQFGKEREALEKQVPKSEAAELEKIQQREAGLEALAAKREQRAGEAYDRAEKESSQGMGEALMSLAGLLISTPRTDPRFATGINNFTGMLGAVRKNLNKAASERDKALDLIEESRELRKVGQFEKAEAKYQEGQRRLFDFDTTVKQAAIAADTARNSNLLNYAGNRANNEVRAIEKKLDTLKTGYEVASRENIAARADETNRLIANYEGQVRQRVAETAYGSKEQQAINNALDNARKNALVFIEKNPAAMTDPSVASSILYDQQRRALKTLGYDDAKIKQLLGAGGSERKGGFTVLGPETR